MTVRARAILASATLACTAGATTACAAGRTVGPMVTDRPDFTESASTVAPGHIQVEAGYTFTDGDAAIRHDVGEVLARAGVGESTELRIGLGSYGIEHPAGSPTVHGLSSASTGAKVRLRAAGLADEAALLVATTLPLDTELGDPGWTPSALLAAAWSAGSTDLGANVGYTHVETGDGTGEILASFAGGIPVNDRIGSFMELYGQLPLGGSARAVVDGGLTLTLRTDLQLDLRVGRGVVGGTDTTVGAGLAIRF